VLARTDGRPVNPVGERGLPSALSGRSPTLNVRVESDDDARTDPMLDRCTECLYWPAAIRTAEHVAILIPARAYWASCVHCGATIDLAAAVRLRVTQSGGDRAGRPRDRGSQGPRRVQR